MSTHKSLIAKSKLQRRRNVLKRIERLKILEERGRWSAGQSVFGLPMTRTIFKVKKSRKLKEEAPDATAAAGDPAGAAGRKKADS